MKEVITTGFFLAGYLLACYFNDYILMFVCAGLAFKEALPN
jgi:hypothetical protein